MRITLIAILSFCSLIIWAQNISVVSMQYDENDLTANLKETTVLDQNGEKCALLRIQTTMTGFTFDVGSLGVQHVEQKTGEIWVYVPHGVKKLTLRHQQYGTCTYEFPYMLRKSSVYVLNIKQSASPKDNGLADKQYLQITVNPQDALVYLDDEPVQTENGKCIKLVSLGTHTYKATLSDYHDSEGRINVADANQKTIFNIDMKPEFGWLEIGNISDDYSGASVYVDSKLIGKIPFDKTRMSSGNHDITINHNLYKPYKGTFRITEGTTTTYQFNMTPNFQDVTLRTQTSGATIYIDEQKMGTNIWQGKLINGLHRIEARKAGYKPLTMDVNVGVDAPRITLPQLTATYGGVHINVMPAGADVIIDGNNVGQTPLLINKILAGPHEISVNMANHMSYKKNINIKDGEMFLLEDTLNNGNNALKLLEMIEWPDKNTDPQDNKIYKSYDELDQTPSFPAGQRALMEWLSCHVKYPAVAEENGIQGCVIVKFVVDKDGSITEVKVEKGVDQSLDKEAVRVVSSMPKWFPGKKEGMNVRVQHFVPIVFSLPDPDTSEKENK